MTENPQDGRRPTEGDEATGLTSVDIEDEEEDLTWLLLTNIIFNRVDTPADGQDPLSLTGLNLMGIPGWEGDRHYPLMARSSMHWELTSYIELPVGVREFGCFLTREDEANILTHIVCEVDDPIDGHKHDIVVLGSDIRLEIIWDAVDLPSEVETAADLFDILNSSAISLSRQFEATGDVEYISNAISAQERVVQLVPERHESLPGWLSNLGNFINRRFQHSGDLDDLSECLSAHQRAIELTPPDDSEYPARLGNLGVSLQYAYERNGDADLIHRAVETHREALRRTPEGGPTISTTLVNLGNALLCRLERGGGMEDLSEAIQVLELAIETTADGKGSLAQKLNSLGAALRHRFSRTGEPKDIDSAISAQKRAADLTREADTLMPIVLNNLGISYELRFERTGDLPDILESVSLHRRCVDLTPDGHLYLPSRLSNLGTALTTLFKRSRDMSHIAEAIEVHQRAIEITPDDGHPLLPSHLTHLASAFTTRFNFTGETEDIEEAIFAGRRSIELTPEGHPTLIVYLNNLGVSLRSRFEHSGDLSDIVEVVASMRKATSLVPDGHADTAVYLNTLANALLRLFERSQDTRDIDEAISTHQRAVDSTPVNSPDLLARVYQLGTAYHARFRFKREAADIERALSAHRQAVNIVPDGHPDLPLLHTHLGSAYVSRYEVAPAAEGIEDLRSGISHFKIAALCSFGNPSMRMSGAEGWALLSTQDPQSTEVIEAFDTAVSLITSKAGLKRTIRRRFAEVKLRDTSSFVREAGAAACRQQRPDKAVEWLEQGRCLIWGQVSGLRSSLEDLAAQDGSLAKEMVDVAKQLDAMSSLRASSTLDMPIAERILSQKEARVHLDLARRWKDLLAAARAIPGCESLLKPAPSSSLLERLPKEGYVVLINVHSTRCDALVLQEGQTLPLQIPLPSFSFDKAERYCLYMSSKLQSQGMRTRQAEPRHPEAARSTVEDPSLRALALYKLRVNNRTEERSIHGVLEALWLEVVKPILDVLQLPRNDHGTPDQLPRIWWCPTGPLCFLPLHAAGTYRVGDVDSVNDYLVSSYTPTVTSLADRAEKIVEIPDTVAGLFLTSQPRVAGLSPIPGTVAEVTSISEKLIAAGCRLLKVEGEDLTVDGCLERMEEFSSVHLACHASQHEASADPLASQFRFHTGSLDLGRIMQRDLKTADLAFLSACQTSAGEQTLSDEAVHLAAGMLAAGYRSVVASDW